MTLSAFRKGSECNDLTEETRVFLWKKIKPLLPTYIISFAICFVSFCLTSSSVRSLHDLAVTAFRNIPGFLTFADLAITDKLRSVNSVTWYISTMLLVMALLYPLVRKSRYFQRIGAPVLGFVILGYLCITFRSLLNPRAIALNGLLFKGYLRGLSEICLGILSFNITRYHLDQIKPTLLGRLLLNGIEVLSFIIIMFTSVFSGNGQYDFICIIAIIFFISLSFSKHSLCSDLFNNKLCYYLGKVSLSIFLSHISIIFIFSYRKPAFFESLSLSRQVCLVLSLAVILGIAVDWLSRLKLPLSLFVKENDSSQTELIH